MEVAKDSYALIRVNLEAKLFGDKHVDKVAHFLKWSVREAIGCLALIWYGSQNERKTYASTKEINDWAAFWDDDRALVEALSAADFLRPTGDGQWEIVGNKQQFESLDAWRTKKSEAGKRGNEKRWASQDDHEPIADDRRCDEVRDDLSQTHRENRSVSVTVSGSVSGTKKGEEEPPPLGGILVDMWQKHSGELPKIKGTLTSFELTKIKDRLKENPDPTYWRGLIEKMAATKFFHGKNKFKWRADLLWLIEPGNHTKVATRDYSAGDDEVGADQQIDWSRYK